VSCPRPPTIVLTRLWAFGAGSDALAFPHGPGAVERTSRVERLCAPELGGPTAYFVRCRGLTTLMKHSPCRIAQWSSAKFRERGLRTSSP